MIVTYIIVKTMNDKIVKFPNKKERKKIKVKIQGVHNPAEPIIKLPHITKLICAVNIAMFAFTYLLQNHIPDQWGYALAFVPARYSADLFNLSAITSPFTYMFIHAGWVHLIVNIAMLMAFGSAMEKQMGQKRFVILYIATGLCGVLLHQLFYMGDTAPVVGASGAISGLFGAVIVLMQAGGYANKASLKKLMPVILIWIVISVAFGMMGAPGIDNAVAWAVHIGGFLGGVFLYKPIHNLKL